MYYYHVMEPGCSSESMGDSNKNSIITENKRPRNADAEIIMNRKRRTPLHEEVYQDRLADHRELDQLLRDGKLDEYAIRIKRLEIGMKDELVVKHSQMEDMRETIEKDYEKTHHSFKKFLGDRKDDIRETLEEELLERKKAIEYEYLTMELLLDLAEEKPNMIRKLRRRPNDPVILPPQEKRRKPPPVLNIRYMLQDNEIEEDLKAIQELASVSSTSTTAATTLKTQDTVISSSDTKSGLLPSLSPSDGDLSSKKCDSSDDEVSSTISDIRIEDGKLLFEKRWYHRGQPVFVEGRELVTFSAVIIAIGNETIWVKNISDNSKFRIFLSNLSKGKISIKRRAAL